MLFRTCVSYVKLLELIYTQSKVVEHIGPLVLYFIPFYWCYCTHELNLSAPTANLIWQISEMWSHCQDYYPMIYRSFQI